MTRAVSTTKARPHASDGESTHDQMQLAAVTVQSGEGVPLVFSGRPFAIAL
jgi:hypothetical protein